MLEPTEVMVPLDINYILTQGPAYIMLSLVVFWYARREAWFEVQMAAKDALISGLMEKRLEDQKVLLPLANSMVAAAEQSNELVKRALVK